MDKPDLSKLLEHYGADLTRVREHGWCDVKCPFHDDRNASARVNLELGKFKCFACEYAGDSIDLITRREGIEFKDAIAYARTNLGFEGSAIRQESSRLGKRYKPHRSEDDD